MVEPRPESASTAAIRRIVNDALSAQAADADRVAAGARPRRMVDWPDDQLDLAPRGTRGAAPTFVANPDRRYALGEFTRFHDQEFIVAAFRGLLERPADPAGLAHYLRMLRQGIAKVEILGRLRYSTEGKRVDASVPTLRLRYPLAVASRQPVIGNLLGLVDLLVRANAVKSSIRRLEAHVAEVARHQAVQVDGIDASARRNAAILEARVEALRDR